jgi:hypothetical protein
LEKFLPVLSAPINARFCERILHQQINVEFERADGFRGVECEGSYGRSAEHGFTDQLVLFTFDADDPGVLLRDFDRICESDHPKVNCD